MFKHWMEIVHNHDKGYIDWLFHQNVFALRESASIISGNGKGITLEELLRNPFTKLGPSFPSNSIKNFFKVQFNFLLLIVLYFISYTYDQKQL